MSQTFTDSSAEQANPLDPATWPIVADESRPTFLRRAVVFGVAGLLVAVSLAWVLPRGGDLPRPRSAGVGRVGSPAVDGTLQFTVTRVKAGVTRLGGPALSARPRGQFVLVRITVKNLGKEARLVDVASQSLYDRRGHKFAAMPRAATYLVDANGFLERIRPGSWASGMLVFDVPRDAALSRLELHDRPASRGVHIAID